jgi:hypothetical protein
MFEFLYALCELTLLEGRSSSGQGIPSVKRNPRSQPGRAVTSGTVEVLAMCEQNFSHDDDAE